MPLVEIRGSLLSLDTHTTLAETLCLLLPLIHRISQHFVQQRYLLCASCRPSSPKSWDRSVHPSGTGPSVEYRSPLRHTSELHSLPFSHSPSNTAYVTLTLCFISSSSAWRCRTRTPRPRRLHRPPLAEHPFLLVSSSVVDLQTPMAPPHPTQPQSPQLQPMLRPSNDVACPSHP